MLASALTAGALDMLGATSTMTELSKSAGLSDKLTENRIKITEMACPQMRVTAARSILQRRIV